MLKEFTDVQQEKSGFRRLFSDDYFDLYMWYDKKGGMITGFQLVYDREHNPHALTWIKSKGYWHNRIDDGEDIPGGPKKSPVLVPDGTLQRESLIKKFKAASQGIEPIIAQLVLERLEKYDNMLKQTSF
jgi:hypothetical protein